MFIVRKNSSAEMSHYTSMLALNSIGFYISLQTPDFIVFCINDFLNDIYSNPIMIIT